MTIDPTTSTRSSASATPALAQPATSLGQDAFMQLLVTQLKNQDPTQPQDSSQFVAQLAQFTSLEKLTSMNQSLTALTSIDASLAKITQLLSGIGASTTTSTGTTSTTQS